MMKKGFKIFCWICVYLGVLPVAALIIAYVSWFFILNGGRLFRLTSHEGAKNTKGVCFETAD